MLTCDTWQTENLLPLLIPMLSCSNSYDNLLTWIITVATKPLHGPDYLKEPLSEHDHWTGLVHVGINNEVRVSSFIF